MGRMDGKVAFITGHGAGSGSLACAPPGRGGCRDHRRRPVPAGRHGAVRRWPHPTISPRRPSSSRNSTGASWPVRPTCVTWPNCRRVVQEGVSEFGHIDVVCANAGIADAAPTLEMDERAWQEMIDINLTGVWKTIKAAVAPMVERRQGGAVIITSSVAGLVGFPNLGHYSAAKHGVVGSHASAGPGVGAVHDPRQHREPDHGRHADGGRRRHLPTLPPGPGEPDPRRRGRGTRRPERTCPFRGSRRST